jgi:hypothetical protein
MSKSEYNPTKKDCVIFIGVVVASIVVLLWGMRSGNPYGYYIFLRIIVCMTAFMLWATFAGLERPKFVVLFLSLCILYNPIIPIHLNREIWTVINLGTIAAFSIGLVYWWKDLSKPA